jgi:hypothetical protein
MNLSIDRLEESAWNPEMNKCSTNIIAVLLYTYDTTTSYQVADFFVGYEESNKGWKINRIVNI